MKTYMVKLATIFVCCVGSSVALAQSTGGGAFIPIQDGSSHDCIDVTKYTVSMSVFTVQVKRTNSYWKSSKSLGVKIDVKLLNQESRPFNFPRGRQLSVSGYEGDIGLLPMIFPLMAKYSLIDPNDQRAYVNVGLDVYLINIEATSALTKGILSFIDFSKDLPLPANPYQQGVQLFGNFAQKIISDNIQTAADKLPAATLAFDLASDNADVSKCEKQSAASWRYPTLREGIVAVMWDHDGGPEKGFIQVSDVDKYCYYPSASKRINFAHKVNGACPSPDKAKPLNNPLVAIAIAKWSQHPKSVSSFNIGPIQQTMTEPFLSSSTAQAVVHSEQNKGRFYFGSYDGVQSMNAKGVKTYFDAINKGDLYQEFYKASKDTATKAGAVREAETAIALHRCSLVGIAPQDCL